MEGDKMKATITGSDDLSKRILIDLNRGMKVAKIPEHYPVSLDQAKRLSRFNKMLKLASEHLNEDLAHRLQQLGIKSLPLSSLFRQADWDGIIEILSVVTDETKRDELELLIDALKEKRDRINEFKGEIDLSLLELERIEQSLRTKEKEILLCLQDWNKHLQVFESYPRSIRSCLEEYLGVFNGRLVLAKRLHANWEQHLREDGMIEYDGNQSVYYIKDIHRFVESLKSSHNHGIKNHPVTQESIGPASAHCFVDSINRLKQELREIQEKKPTIEEELIRIKQETVQSYMRLAQFPDYLSAAELKRHKEIQFKALKWLFNRGFITMADFTLPNGNKADIFAYNESQIVIFEIKVSKNDLITDHKWTECLPYCHDFFFLTPDELKDDVITKINSINCGQFIETANSIQLIHADERHVNQVNQEDELKFAAAQYLSRRFIYGY
jgi:hypothetical protein